LKYIEPMLSREEFTQAKQDVNALLNSGSGQRLQKFLEARVADFSKCEMNSWLLDWWSEHAYLAYRQSAPVFSNFYCNFEPTSPTPSWQQTLLSSSRKRSAAGTRAASLCTGLFAFRELLLNDKIPQAKAGRSPLCMKLLNNTFNCCRVADAPIDRIARFDRFQNHHIVVLHRDQFYSLQVATCADHIRHYLSFDCLATIFDKLLATTTSKQQQQQLPIGHLTSDHRDRWYEARLELTKLSHNRDVFALIESSLFVLCLDSHQPTDIRDSDKALFHNFGKNRFFDKPIQLVVFPNGAAGTNIEHSGWDGTTVVPVFEFVLAFEKNAQRVQEFGTLSTPISALQHLVFELPPNFERVIEQSRTRVIPLCAAVDNKHLSFTGYGKDFIKRCRLSPDALVQMALQLTYYQLFSRLPPIYESGTTRRFQWGRTETIRSFSNQSLAFVKAFTHHKQSDSELIDFLHKAVKEHTRRSKEACVDAAGIDRHLLGLHNAAKQLVKTDKTFVMPKLFTSSLFSKKMFHWQMSTSNLSNDMFEAGWGAVVRDGLGFSYIIRDKSIQIKASSLPDCGTTLDIYLKAFQNNLVALGKLLSTNIQAKL